MIVTLDPGHGKNSNKGVLTGYYEGTQVFKLANFLRSELEQYEDVTVFLTKNDVTDNPSLDSRGKTAVNNGSELFISLHSNAASQESAHGVSVFRSVNSMGSAELGRSLGNGIAELMRLQTGNTYMRGIFTRTYESLSGKTYDYYGVIRAAVSGGMKYAYIIEHGFHTNKAECAYMLKDANLERIAKREAEIIAEYFGLRKRRIDEPVDDPEEVPGSDREYTVKRGDTLIKIANLYGTTAAVLAEYNGIPNPDLIIVGQVIRIPEPEDAVFSVGERVRIKPYKTTYFPDGKRFSKWVHDYDYIIAKIVDGKGNAVYRNGHRCVLLGRKINKVTGAQSAPINSWCSVSYITKV